MCSAPPDSSTLAAAVVSARKSRLLRTDTRSWGGRVGPATIRMTIMVIPSSGRARRRQADRREEAERRLLMAAAELIGEVGPTKMRLSDIGERAGYSRGLATHYFGTKGALVRQIMDTVTNDFHKELASHDNNQGAVASITDIVSTYFLRLRDDEPMIRARIALWAEAAAGGSHEERSHAISADERFRREIHDRLENGLAAGEVPGDLDLGAFTTVIIGMLRGTAVQHLLDRDVDLARCEAEAMAFVEARLSPRGPD